MNIQEVMNRIKLCKEAQEHVMHHLMEENVYRQKRQLFFENEADFFCEWEKDEERFQWILPFYLQLACEVYEEYQSKGISGQVFNDTFSDITIWCEECFRRNGFYGIEEVKWIANSICMRLFRLGRLQFEPLTLKENMIGETVNLPSGSSVLNVHIPAGEKMDYLACLDSFKKAEEFFGDSYAAYMCDSWLLSPVLKEFLPENSNIVRFQNLFEIIRVYYDYPQGEGRIFQDVREDKENYPENSRLQRAAKKYILNGKDLGIGVGAFYK